MPEVDEVLCHSERRFVAERLHVDKVGAELRQRPHDDGRNASLPQFPIGRYVRVVAVDGREEDAIDSARDEVTQNRLLALGLVPRVVQDQLVAVFEGALLDRHHDAREDRIGGGRDHQPQQPGLAIAQAARSEVWRVAHALGQVTDAQLGPGGDVRCVPQRLRDGHHRDAGFAGYVLESYHGFRRAIRSIAASVAGSGKMNCLAGGPVSPCGGCGGS